jgi:hypothetical protein
MHFLLRKSQRKPNGFYNENLYKKNKSVPKTVVVKKVPAKKNVSKRVVPKNQKESNSICNTELENFKNDFQFEIIKSLKSPGLTTRRGMFSISIGIANELRNKYGINCRFSRESSEK